MTQMCSTVSTAQKVAVYMYHPPFDVPMHHNLPRPSMEVLQSPAHITGHLHPNGWGQGAGIPKVSIKGAPGHEGIEEAGPRSITAPTQQWQ